MEIYSLADKYTIWTKSTIVEILETLGDEEFERSQSKPELLEHVQNYFVPDVLAAADLKALTQLAEAAAVTIPKNARRDKLCAQLTAFQHNMKDLAIAALEHTPEDSPEFMEYAHIVLTTDPELHEQFESLIDEDSASEG